MLTVGGGLTETAAMSSGRCRATGREKGKDAKDEGVQGLTNQAHAGCIKHRASARRPRTTRRRVEAACTQAAGPARGVTGSDTGARRAQRSGPGPASQPTGAIADGWLTGNERSHGSIWRAFAHQNGPDPKTVVVGASRSCVCSAALDGQLRAVHRSGGPWQGCECRLHQPPAPLALPRFGVHWWRSQRLEAGGGARNRHPTAAPDGDSRGPACQWTCTSSSVASIEPFLPQARSSTYSTGTRTGCLGYLTMRASSRSSPSPFAPILPVISVSLHDASVHLGPPLDAQVLIAPGRSTTIWLSRQVHVSPRETPRALCSPSPGPRGQALILVHLDHGPQPASPPCPRRPRHGRAVPVAHPRPAAAGGACHRARRSARVRSTCRHLSRCPCRWPQLRLRGCLERGAVPGS